MAFAYTHIPDRSISDDSSEKALYSVNVSAVQSIQWHYQHSWVSTDLYLKSLTSSPGYKPGQSFTDNRQLPMQ